jgi:glycerol dehydrogenase-like iron-containing ADH family enzyme
MNVSYGDGNAASELLRLGDYVLIAGDRAWNQCSDDLPKPTRRFAPRNLDQRWLNTLAAEMPDLPIVGLGGGTAMDAAKYCASSRGTGVLLVPTLTSTTAPFTDRVSVRINGSVSGIRMASLSSTVIVDNALLIRTNPRLNRAGFGDLVALGTTLEDWQDAASRGLLQLDERLALELAQLVGSAIAAASLVGEAQPSGLETLMRLFELSERILGRHPEAPNPAGSEHLFAWVAESLTGREFMHGELVALGVVIAEHLTGGFRYREAFDQAKVPWRPDELGLRWSEVIQTLRQVRNYNDEVRHFDAILPRIDWSANAFRGLRADLESGTPARPRGARRRCPSPEGRP